MPSNQYSIRVYSPNNDLLRVLSTIQSARYRLAENEAGDFEITVPWKDNTLPLLLSPPNTVEFYRDSVFVFGGIIRRQSARQEGRVPFYTCSGPSYLQWLADARIRPVTGTADVEFPGNLPENTIKNAVRAHVLDNNTQFVVESDVDTSYILGWPTDSVYTATAYETVMETCQALATRAGNVTFDIVRDLDGILRFKTWLPSRGPDRSIGTASPVLFDMRGGNLLDAEWTRDGNQVVNALWGGGPGDKAARYIWPDTEALTDAQSILDWGRIEGFIDAGNETTDEVQKKVREELQRSALPEESVSFKIAQFGRYTLGTDFDFGTKVTVLWSPILEFSDTIRGMEVRLDAGSGVAEIDINVGDTITGDSATRASIYLGKFMRKLRRQISVQTRH